MQQVTFLAVAKSWIHSFAFNKTNEREKKNIGKKDVS